MGWNLEWLQSFRSRDCASQSSSKAAEIDYNEPWDTDCLQSVLYIIAKDWPEVSEKLDFTKSPSKRNFTSAYSPDESVVRDFFSTFVNLLLFFFVGRLKLKFHF